MPLSRLTRNHSRSPLHPRNARCSRKGVLQASHQTILVNRDLPKRTVYCSYHHITFSNGIGISAVWNCVAVTTTNENSCNSLQLTQIPFGTFRLFCSRSKTDSPSLRPVIQRSNIAQESWEPSGSKISNKRGSPIRIPRSSLSAIRIVCFIPGFTEAVLARLSFQFADQSDVDADWDAYQAFRDL